MFHRLLKYKKFLFYSALALGLFLAIILSWANVKILRYRNNILYSLDDVPTTTYALVFGGGMHSKYEMSNMQTDRVIQGVNLYKAGRVQKVFITGDDGGVGDDEVTAMRQFAIDNGVKPEDVLVDPHGYRTYESCYREYYVYGLTSTVVVSQAFHLPRISYFCETMGIQTIPVAADLRPYGWRTVASNIRETLARLKGVWQMEASKPMPRSLEK